MPTFEAEDLTSFCERLFVAAGTPVDDAKWIAQSMVKANLEGHDSHGIIMVRDYLGYIREGRIKPGAKVAVTRELPSVALLDGGWNFGQIVARKAVELAIKKAKESGFAIVGAFNSNHVGRVANYCELAAKEGLVGIMLVNNPGGSYVAPWGGIERRLGTNPISAFIPRVGKEPIILDMATSVVAAGKIMLRVGTGERLPEGWIIDKEGKSSTRAEDFEDGGALLPAGAYKGFGLSILVDVLAGALTGAGGCNREGVFGTNGIFIVAMRPDIFVSGNEFSSSVEGIVNFVKGSELQKGFKEIQLPRERAISSTIERKRSGISIHNVVWESLKESAEKLGVSLPSYLNK